MDQKRAWDGLRAGRLQAEAPLSWRRRALTPTSTGTGQIETLTTDRIKMAGRIDPGEDYLLQVVLTGPGVCLYGAEVTYH